MREIRSRRRAPDRGPVEKPELRPRPPRPQVTPESAWEHVLDSLPEGILAVDGDGNVVAMNQAAESLTGSSFASAAGRHHARVFRQNRWLSDLVDDVARRDRGGIRAEGQITGLWGRSLPVRASASPTVDPEGRRTGVAVILQDLTVQVGLEADQQRARSLSSLGDVVAGLAHEIKNPLSGIRGAVQLLAQEIRPAPAASDYIKLVLREVDRLTALLEQLLRLGARGELEVSGVNVHEVIEHVLALTAAEARQSGVQVARLFDPSLPPVRGHRDSLVQVVLNLVQNAIQALASLPDGASRELRVHTRIETDYHFESPEPEGSGRMRFVRVDLEDTGPGIPPELHSNLFSPFVTTKPKGTGLGLAISHRIVSDLGGTIRLESEPGRTLFRVILPIWGSQSP